MEGEGRTGREDRKEMLSAEKQLTLTSATSSEKEPSLWRISMWVDYGRTRRKSKKRRKKRKREREKEAPVTDHDARCLPEETRD